MRLAICLALLPRQRRRSQQQQSEAATPAEAEAAAEAAAAVRIRCVNFSINSGPPLCWPTFALYTLDTKHNAGMWALPHQSLTFTHCRNFAQLLPQSKKKINGSSQPANKQRCKQTNKQTKKQTNTKINKQTRQETNSD